MSTSASDIYKCLIDLVPAAAALPAVELTGKERMALSGSTSGCGSRTR